MYSLNILPSIDWFCTLVKNLLIGFVESIESKGIKKQNKNKNKTKQKQKQIK